MADVTIVEGAEGAEVPATQGEVIAAETAEVLAEATVEVAQIEADKEVAIAEIQAETVTELQADNNAAVVEEQNEWQRNIETRLAATEASQTEMLSILRELRSEPLSQPERLESPEVTPENQEVPEPPAPKAKPHHRLI